MSPLRRVVAAAAVAATCALVPTGPLVRARRVTRGTPLFMGGSAGVASTLDGKKSRVAALSTLLEGSEFAFTIPNTGITVPEGNELRAALPEGSTATVVKNTLMARAAEGTEWDVATPELALSNMWIFVGDDIKGSLKAVKDWAKASEKAETHDVVLGVIDGGLLDTAEVAKLAKLPSKLELIARIAGALNMAGAEGIAKRIKQVPTKLGRAIKMAKVDEASE